MHAETHRIRLFLISVLLSLLALGLLARPVHSRWSAGPVDRHVTRVPGPLVAVNDEARDRAPLTGRSR